MNTDCDVIIVGGGPAGLASAIQLRLYGHDVKVFDKQEPPIDKPCGEGLMPQGVTQLENLGIDIDDSWSHPFRGVRYLDGKITLEGTFFEGLGRGIRRPVLHKKLSKRAREIDVDLLWNTAVSGFEDNQVKTDSGKFTSNWIVGADGLHSDVREWSELSKPNNRKNRFGFVRHYSKQPWTDYVEVYWHDQFEIYVTPVDQNQVGVALLTEDQSMTVGEALGCMPELKDKLDKENQIGSEHGWGPLYQTVSGVRSDNVCLIGDAAGYSDAITGEGLSIAFKEAYALSEAIEAKKTKEYERAYKSIVRLPEFLIETLLWLRQYPGLRRRMMRLFSGSSLLFSVLLTLNDRGFRNTLSTLISGEDSLHNFSTKSMSAYQ